MVSISSFIFTSILVSYKSVHAENVHVSSLPDLHKPHFLPFHYYTSPLRKKTEVAKHNCSVTDKTESSEICTIGVTRQCRDEKVMLGRVETEEQCFQATKTVCTVNTVNVQAQKCNYQYQPR